MGIKEKLIKEQNRRYIWLFMAVLFLGIVLSFGFEHTVLADTTYTYGGAESNPWNILRDNTDTIDTGRAAKILSLSYLLRTWTIWACIVSIVYYLLRIAFPTRPSDIDEAKSGIIQKIIIVICVSGLATILNVIKLILDTSAGYPTFTI